MGRVRWSRILVSPAFRWACLSAIVLVTLIAVGTEFGVGRHLLAPRPLHLAVLTSLSGPFAPPLRELLRGAELYIEAVNHAGGVAGRRVQLDLYDDRSDATNVPHLVKEVARSQALIAIALQYADVGAIASAALKAARLPTVTNVSPGEQSPRDNPYFFITMFSQSGQGQFIASYVQQVLRQPLVSIIHGADAYSGPLVAAFQEALA